MIVVLRSTKNPATGSVDRALPQEMTSETQPPELFHTVVAKVS